MKNFLNGISYLIFVLIAIALGALAVGALAGAVVVGFTWVTGL